MLVTGGLGFVGSNLVNRLYDLGYSITVIDNLISESSSRDYMIDDVEYWIDDVRNLNTRYYLDHDFDIIFHLAAHARIQPSFIKPAAYFSNDAQGTVEVLEYARNCDASIVYSGSSTGFSDEMLNPYAFAKRTGERACELYHKIYGMSTVIARFFNVYGPHQPITGPWATVIGLFEEKAKTGDPLTVVGNGHQRRDFTHVSDIVDGLIALGNNKWKCETFSLGTGRNYSILEIVNLFGCDKVHIPSRPGEAKVTLADHVSMHLATDWSPVHSLEDYIIKFRETLEVEKGKDKSESR